MPTSWRELIEEVRKRQQEVQRQTGPKGWEEIADEFKREKSVEIKTEEVDVKKEIFQLLAKRTPDQFNVLKAKLTSWRSERNAANRVYVATLNSLAPLSLEEKNVADDMSDFLAVMHILLSTPKSFVRPIYLLNSSDIAALSKFIANALKYRSEMMFQDFVAMPLMYNIVSALTAQQPLPPPDSRLNSAAVLFYPMIKPKAGIGVPNEKSGGVLIPFDAESKKLFSKYMLHLGNVLPMYALVRFASGVSRISFVFVVKDKEVAKIGTEGDMPMSVPLDVKALKDFFAEKEDKYSIIEEVRKITQKNHKMTLQEIIIRLYKQKKVPMNIMSFEEFFELVPGDAREKLDELMKSKKLMLWIPDIINLVDKSGRLNLKNYLGYRRFLFDLLAGASMATTKLTNMM